MSKEKQNSCEAAWKEWTKSNPFFSADDDLAIFSAGFRAGEEGVAELLEVLKDLYSATAPHFDGKPDTIRVRGLAQAAIAKHTAK